MFSEVHRTFCSLHKIHDIWYYDIHQAFDNVYLFNKVSIDIPLHFGDEACFTHELWCDSYFTNLGRLESTMLINTPTRKNMSPVYHRHKTCII